MMMMRSQLELSTCSFPVLLRVVSHLYCCPSSCHDVVPLAFSSLIIFWQYLAMCPLVSQLKHSLSNWLSVASLFSCFELSFLKTFAFPFLALSSSLCHCVNVRRVSVCPADSHE